jgi:hypothetical protein
MPALLPPWLAVPPEPLVGCVVVPAPPSGGAPSSLLQWSASSDSVALVKIRGVSRREVVEGVRMIGSWKATRRSFETLSAPLEPFPTSLVQEM